MKWIFIVLLFITGCKANPNDATSKIFDPNAPGAGPGGGGGGGGGGSSSSLSSSGPAIGHVSLLLNLPTSTAKGLYIWVTQASTYINTIQRYSGGGNGQSDNNPVNWLSSGASSVDGVTSATIFQNSSYQSKSWNCKNKSGQDVSYGSYNVKLEICQHGGSRMEYSGTIAISSNANTSGTLVPSDGTMSSGTINFTTN
jgi:hypothetical protein